MADEFDCHCGWESVGRHAAGAHYADTGHDAMRKGTADMYSEITPWRAIPQQAQRQDALDDQLRDVAEAAKRLGCYDAADWIRGRTLA